MAGETATGLMTPRIVVHLLLWICLTTLLLSPRIRVTTPFHPLRNYHFCLDGLDLSLILLAKTSLVHAQYQRITFPERSHIHHYLTPRSHVASTTAK